MELIARAEGCRLARVPLPSRRVDLRLGRDRQRDGTHLVDAAEPTGAFSESLSSYAEEGAPCARANRQSTS